MDFDNPFAGIFPDSQCATQDTIEITDTNGDGADLLPLPGSTRPTSTPQGPVSNGHDLSHTKKLGLLQLEEWDDEKSYDEDPPRYIRYDLQWKITVNTKRKTGDTTTDLALTPSSHWPVFVKPEVEGILLEWQSEGRPLAFIDVNVKLSVNQRGQSPFEKRFKTDIHWPVVEEQILKWEEFARGGKKIKVEVSLNYKPLGGSKKGTKGSATQRQLAVQALQRDAEAEHGRIWRETYAVFRCEDKFCNLHNYCWHDPVKEKHYPLSTFEMLELVEIVEKGGTATHDRFPNDMREALYAAELRKSGRKRVRTTDVPVGHPQQTSVVGSQTTAGPSAQIAKTGMSELLNIPGYKDDAVKDYVRFLQGKWRSQRHKDGFQEAGEVVLDAFIDLDQVYREQNPEFFTTNKVEKGIAVLFIRDIPEFAEHQKLDGN